MWIIPKTLSAFVPDTEGLNLDLDERAWILESSVTMRSKPSSKPTWLRRLKKGGWITRLSTRILKPSLHQSFEEKYTDSLEDIHVSPSVQQGSEKAKTTQDTYGHISESTSGQLDLFGAFSKMSEVTPRWGYGESCPIWKKMVTERSGDYSARRKQARLTNASDASSLGGWATPMSGTKDHMSLSVEYYQRRQKIGKQVDLNGQVILDKWATPQSTDGDRINQVRKPSELSEKAKKGGCRNLREDVQNWATPNTMDCLPSRSYEAMKRQATTGGRKNRKRPGNLREQIDPLMCQAYEDASKEANQQNWPTPLEDDSSNVNPSPKRRDGLVAKVVKQNGPPAQEKSNTSGKNHGSWPTARSSDAEGGRIKTEKTEKGFRSKREKSDQYFGAKLRDAAEMEKPPSMKLNPNWVEQLMGLEVGWTQLPTEWIDSDS